MPDFGHQHICCHLEVRWRVGCVWAFFRSTSQMISTNFMYIGQVGLKIAELCGISSRDKDMSCGRPSKEGITAKAAKSLQPDEDSAKDKISLSSCIGLWKFRASLSTLGERTLWDGIPWVSNHLYVSPCKRIWQSSGAKLISAPFLLNTVQHQFNTPYPVILIWDTTSNISFYRTCS